MPDTGWPRSWDWRHVRAGMVPLVGGKAANLGELLSAGLPVPDGFCLTTDGLPPGHRGRYRRTALDGALLAALAGIHARPLDGSPDAPPTATCPPWPRWPARPGT